MLRVQIGEFRDGVSRFVRRAELGETIVILNRDREVAVLQPVPRERKGKRLLGFLKGTATVKGDLLEPIPLDTWFQG